METACLKIKFTPLLQNDEKNSSKCCLEIVPEVSCIQNLDKLTWRQETNFIEYTIPMTYKVILKKRQTIKEISNEVVKTYHSCVDLLLSSSKSTLNIGSGDVTKIISDTFILSKSIAYATSKENMRSVVDAGTNNAKVVRNDYCPLTNKFTNTSLEVKEVKTKGTNDNIEHVETDVRENIECDILDETSLDKITNTDNAYPIFSDTVQCGNSVIHLVPSPRPSIKPEDKRRLSLSPICSISTQETPLLNRDMASKAVTCKIYNSLKEIIPLGNISEPSNLSNDHQNICSYAMLIDSSGRSSPKGSKCKVRVPPEIRVAEYMQYVEKEVLPLKLMLNEIFSKCAALGITFSKKSSIQSLMCNSTSTYSISRSQEISRSNRVVYSIVFDG